MFISIDDAVIFKANNYSHRFNKRRVLETHFTMKLDLIQYFVVCRKNMKRSFIPHFRIILLIYLRGCFPFWECEFRNYLLKFKRKANFVGVFSAKKMFAIKLNFNPNILSVQAKTFDEIFFNMRAIQREFEENFRSEYFWLWTWFVCVWIQHCRATKKQFRQMKPKTWCNGNVLLLISSFK